MPIFVFLPSAKLYFCHKVITFAIFLQETDHPLEVLKRTIAKNEAENCRKNM